MVPGAFRICFYTLKNLVGVAAFQAFLQATIQDEAACRRAIEAMLRHVDQKRLSGAQVLSIDWDGPREFWTVHLERESLPEGSTVTRLLDVTIHEAEVEAARRAFAEAI